MELIVQPQVGYFDNGRPLPLPPKVKKTVPSWPETDFREYQEGSALRAMLTYRDFSIYYYRLEFSIPKMIQLVTNRATVALQFTLTGKAVAELAGSRQVHTLRENVAGLFYLVTGTNLATIHPGPFVSVHIEFSERFLEDLAMDLKEFRDALHQLRRFPKLATPIFAFPINYEVLMAVTTLTTFDIHKHSPIKLKSLVMQLLASLNSCAIENRQIECLVPTVYRDVLLEIKQAISIAPNIKDHALENQAKQFRIEPSTLSRKFYEMFQIHFADYLRLRVMEKALLLITNSKTSITDISMELGYNSKSNFSRAFYKYYQTTPSEVRNNGGLPIDCGQMGL